MKRCMIIGQPGSGKSTLARELGKRTGLPVYHIDQIHWMPGWNERPVEEKGPLCLKIHAKPEWIFEGGHSQTWPDRLERCDTLIWLDIPLWKRVYRIVWRTIKHTGKSRPDMPEDCPERFNWEFTLWIWNTRITGRAKMVKLVKKATKTKQVHVFRNVKSLNTYLSSLD